MTVVVIGASGFIGSHILRSARQAGLHAIGTQSSTTRSDLRHFDLLSDSLESLLSEIAIQRPVFVVVAAALAQIDRCRTEQPLSRSINVDGTIRILREAVTLDSLPVFLSSSFVFDGREGNYVEGSARSPISEYGRQKAEVEQFVERDLPGGLALRLDKTIGDNPNEKHLLTEWWTNIVRNTPISCIRDQRFSPTLVDDVAAGVLLACRSNLRGVYNLCAPDCYLRAELAAQFVREAGRAVPIIEQSQSDLGFVDLRPERSSLNPAAFMEATAFTFTPVARVISTFLGCVHERSTTGAGGTR
jgi:dTDP-4-dehydrorhamnose reductase